jgi:hypothetical protein
MSIPLVILVTIIYVYVSIQQYMSGNNAMCITYFGYAVANIGLITALK